MSGSREKLRAILLSFVMVTSIMAAGVAFTGTAAATDFDGLNSVDSVTAPDIEIAQSDTTQTIDVQYKHEASKDDKETVEVDLNNQISGSASITSVSNIQVTGDTGDVTVDNLQTTSSGGETNGYTFDSEQTSGTDPQVTVSVDVKYDTTGQSTTGTQTVTAKDGNGATATDSPSFVDTPMDLVSSVTRDSDNDGQVDTVIATMDQEVDDSATSFGSDTFTIGASGRSAGQVSAGSGTNDETVAISVSGFPADDTAVTETGGDGLQLEASSGVSSLIDKSGTEHVDSTTRKDISDGAAPTIVDAETSSLDSNGNVDQIDIGFSEPLVDAGDVADASDLSNTNLFTLSTGSITGYSGDTDATSDDNSVTGEDVTADVANLQGSSATPQVTLRTGSLTVEDASGNSNSNDVTVDSSNGVTATLAGEGDNNIKTEIGGNANQPILPGQNAQDLNLIRIRDVSGGDSSLSARTILKMPDGITINEGASDLLITTSGNLQVSGSAIQNNGHQLRINHSASSSGGDLLRVRGLAVDATTNFSAQQGQDASTSDITVDYAIDELDTALLSGEKPQVDVTDGGPGSVGAGASGVAFPGDIDVTAPASIDNAIGNQTNIVVEANASNGITFDTDIDPTNIPVTEPTDGAVDMSEASITENELTIPVTANFTAGETLQIDANDGTDPLQVDVAGDASDFKLDVRTESATASNGEVTADNVAAETTISRPTLDIDDNDAGGNIQSLAVGAEDQRYTASNEQIAITTTDTGQIADGSTVTLTTNRSGVTFNPDQTIQAPDGGDAAEETNNNDANIDVYVDTGSPQPNTEVVTNPSVSADEITFDVETGNQNDIGSGVKIIINDPEFSVASSIPDEARFSLNATFEPRSNVQTTSTETHDDFFEVERPNVEFNSNSNVTLQNDNDGITDARIAGSNPGTNDEFDPADNALVITADTVDNQIPEGTDVTISIPDGSGVTFDQSVDITNPNTGPNKGDGDVEISTTDDNSITGTSAIAYDSTSLTIAIDGDNADRIQNGEQLNIDELFFNATSSAQNVSLDVTTNPGSQVTTTDDNVVKFQSATPSGVFGDARLDTDPGDANNGPDRDASSGGDYGPTDSGESTALQTDGDAKATGETFTSSVYVDNGDGFGNSPVSGAFGQADIDLSIVETPDGSSGASLNDTSLTTNSNGFADFEFTLGDGVGTYIVNASTSNGGTNITYEATPGTTSQLNVTQVKDGLATGTDSNTGTDTDVAVFRVRTEDSGGNIAPADVDFGTVFTGGSASVVELYEDYQVSDGSVGGDEIVSDGDLTNDNGDAFDDGDGDSRTNYIQSNDDNGQAGVFFVAVAGSTEQTVDIELAPESGDISSGSATADLVTVNDVDVAINDSTTSPESTVTATATPQSGDGDVTVPRLSASFSISNTTVATFDAASSVTTNVSGVATVNLTAEENGTATVSAITRNRQGSADITVEEAGTGSPLDGPAGRFDNNGDGDISITELGDAGTAFAQGELTIAELGAVGQEFAS